MSNIILPLDRSAWNHSDTQIYWTPNLYSSWSFLQFFFRHLFYTVVFSFACSLECRWKRFLAGRCVFEPNPNSCCVLTLLLLRLAKWMFLWSVRYFCGNVRHSGLSSQASDSINPFSFLLPCAEMSNRALDCHDLFPSVPQSLKLTPSLKFFPCAASWTQSWFMDMGEEVKEVGPSIQILSKDLRAQNDRL